MYSLTDVSQVGELDDVDGALFSRVSTLDSGRDTHSVSTKYSHTDVSQVGELDNVDGALFSRVSTNDSGRDTNSVSTKYSHTNVSQVGELDYVDGALFSRVSTKNRRRGELDDGALFSRVSTKDSGRGKLDDVDGALFSRVSTKDSGRGVLDDVDGALFSRVSTKDSGRGELDDVDGALFSRVSTKNRKRGELDDVDGALFSRVSTKNRRIGELDDVDGALFSRVSTKDSGRGELDDIDGALFSRVSTKASCRGELDDVDGALFSRVSTKNRRIGELDDVDGALFSRVSTKDSGRGELDDDDGALFSRVSTKDSGRGELDDVDGALFSRVSTKDSGSGELDDVDGAPFSRKSTKTSLSDTHSVSINEGGSDTRSVSTKEGGRDVYSPTFEQTHDVDGALFLRISSQEIGADLMSPITDQSQIEKEHVISGCHCRFSKLLSRKSSIARKVEQDKTGSDKDYANAIHKDNSKSSPNLNTVDRPPFSNRSAPCNLNTQCLELLTKTRQSVTQDATPQRSVVAESSSMLGSVTCPLDSCVRMQSECHNNSYPKISETRTEIVENDTVELENRNIKQPNFSIDSSRSLCEDDSNLGVARADSNRNDSWDYVEGSEHIGLEKENLFNAVSALQCTQSYINMREELHDSSDVPSQGQSVCYINEYDTEYYVKTRGDLTESGNIPSQKSAMFYLDEDNTDTEQHSIKGKKLIKGLNNNITTGDATSYSSLKNLSPERTSTGYGKDATGAKCPIDTDCVAFDNSTKRLLLPKIPANHSEILNEQKPEKCEKRHKRVIWHVVRALILPMISVGVYFWDIGSDIRLAISYRDNGDTNLFWITTACIIVPLILMSVVDVSWLWLDRPHCKPSHVIRYVIGVLTLGRIARAMQYMWHLFKSNTVLDEGKLAWHKKRATEEGRDCYILDFINAFAESAPQLFVQMYLMYAYNLELTMVRTLNLLSSWISIAWTYAAYYRCNREAVTGTQDINIVSFAIFFFSVLSALAVRVICIVYFLVTFKIWIGAILLGGHLITMLLWIILKEKPKLEGTTSSVVGKCLYYIFFAYVSLLCFLNLRDTPAKRRMTAFYILFYIENCIMAVLSFYRMTVTETANEKMFYLLVLPIGFSLHVSLLVAYYHLCHPKTGTYNK